MSKLRSTSSKQHSTLLPKTATKNVGRVYRKISSFQQCRMLLRHCCRFWQRCQIKSNQIYLQAQNMKKKQTERVSTVSKGQNFVRHCCQKWQQHRSNVRLCGKNRSTCSIRQCCFSTLLLVWTRLKTLAKCLPTQRLHFL